MRVPFGYTTAWLAVHTPDGQVVADALHLHAVERIGWGGVDRAYEHGVFVTPVDGWTLAMGQALLVAHDPPDTAALSRRLGVDVQWFLSFRVPEAHGWARSHNGTLVRRFEYVGESGEVVYNDGEPTDVEVRLGIPAADEARPGPYAGSVVPGEDTVMEVARAWSVDPTALHGEDAGSGWYGTL